MSNLRVLKLTLEAGVALRVSRALGASAAVGMLLSCLVNSGGGADIEIFDDAAATDADRVAVITSLDADGFVERAAPIVGYVGAETNTAERGDLWVKCANAATIRLGLLVA